MTQLRVVIDDEHEAPVALNELTQHCLLADFNITCPDMSECEDRLNAKCTNRGTASAHNSLLGSIASR